MRTPPQILIVDDNPTNIDIIETRLAVHGYEILTAGDGEEALAVTRENKPDLILLDVMMPKMDGIEACKQMRADKSLPFIPIIMVTAKSETKDVLAGLEAGADEYLTKPVDHAALVARVKSMLRIKALHDKTQEQAARLAEHSAQLAEWNRALEQRVAEQLHDLERVGRLRRFLSPQVAELIVTKGDEHLLEIHRREITVVFCDLRGFTPFSETAEPEEVMGVLHEYHKALGALINKYDATLEHYAGDGLAVYFNDPVPCPDPAARAVKMAVAMRESVGALATGWRRLGYGLDFGVGIAMGFATLGEIGFEGQYHYGAIGSVLNLASRMCDEAKGGQILISQRVYLDVEDMVEAEPLDDLTLKGFHRPVPVLNVQGLKAEAEAG